MKTEIIHVQPKTAVRKNAGFWMTHTSSIGLKPELYRKGAESLAVIDMQVDYLVVLLKLFEVTGDAAYRDHVILCVNKFLPLFRAPLGVYWFMDAYTGDRKSEKICTKFLSLYTKLLLLLIESLEGKKIYQSCGLFDLSRDR
ncbi:MAG: hypothetical protein HUU37_04230 [Bdellovibrionales bacterium]|nr:hypothetical protein [Bdellovibrionales bacterium]